MFALFYILTVQLTYGATINEICAANKTKTDGILYAELEASGCRDCTIEGNNPMVRRAIQHSFDIIEIYKDSNPHLNHDQDLNLVLSHQLVSQEYLFGPRINDSRIDRSNPLTNALLELHAKYQVAMTGSGYNKIETEYLNDLNNVLKLTSKGRELLECFERKSDNIENKVTVSMSFKYSENGFAGHHEVIPYSEDGKMKLKNVITLNPLRRPMEVLGTYAHELAHACNLDNRIKVNGIYYRIKQLRTQIDNKKLPTQEKNPLIEESNSLVNQWDQWAMLDEIRAFSNEAKLALELATADPIHFCMLPKKEFFSTSEKSNFYDSLEHSLGDGSFGRLVVLHYLGQKDPEVFSQLSFFEISKTKVTPGIQLSLQKIKRLKWTSDFKKKLDELLVNEGWALAN